MKKLITLIVVLMMALTMLTGCGSGADPDVSDTVDIDSLKTFGDLFALENEERQWGVGEKDAVFVFKSGDTYYRAVASVTPEFVQGYLDMGITENWEEEQGEYLAPLKIERIENLNEKMLSQEECDALAGKTAQELMDDGWIFTGHNLEEMVFWMDYGPFVYNVVLDGEVSESEYEDFVDEEDAKDFTVKSVEISGIGSNATEID